MDIENHGEYLLHFLIFHHSQQRVRGVVADPVGVTDPKAAKSLFAEIKLISSHTNVHVTDVNIYASLQNDKRRSL